MSEFDPSQGSHAFQRSAKLPKRQGKGPETPAFRPLASVSGLPLCRRGGGNPGKSPAVSANIPVLRRLSAETGSIRTAARPYREFESHSHRSLIKSPYFPRNSGWLQLLSIRAGECVLLHDLRGLSLEIGPASYRELAERRLIGSVTHRFSRSVFAIRYAFGRRRPFRSTQQASRIHMHIPALRPL